MLIERMSECRIAIPGGEFCGVLWQCFETQIIGCMRPANHVSLPRAFQLMHEPADKWVKLIVGQFALWQPHVLLIDQKQRAMKLVARSMINPRRRLAIGNPMVRVGLSAELPRG